ncbi:MAG: helix-turn-helix domain-containing protein [Acidobacteriia bacterium]|nr:helix-turn-helix domain-containing protein [Terriglobia bacterium]
MNGERPFGHWLSDRRRTLHLTQAELARRVGCATVTLQKIEADERRPSKDMAGWLAEALRVKSEDRAAFVEFARFETPSSRAHQFWPSHSTNLAAALPALIGRDRDVAAVRKRLSGEGVRLLTLTGPPGVGKTSLSLHVAASLLDEFHHGVFFVPLAPLRDPQLVAVAIAQTLGVNTTGGRSPAHVLKEYLGNKHLALVLDNFEHLLAGAPLLAELLAACPWLSFLVTSRAPLRLRGERQFPVQPLALPDPATWPLPEVLGQCPAVALFVDRAKAVEPDFALTERNAASVAEICTRLDGLPLAIELVAARTKLLPPEALLARLSGRVVLSSDGLSDVPERHHTMRKAIDWSYGLLSPEEQVLFARLGVFVGGWTLEAAEKVAGDHDAVRRSPATTLETLAVLVDSSLVVRRDYAGDRRFALLEPVREYALEILEARGEITRMHARHAEYYLSLALEADPRLRTSEQLTWLDRLEAERGNLEAALAWFIETAHDAESGLRLAGALLWFWNIRGYLSEWRRWLTKALDATHSSTTPPGLRARALWGLGGLLWQEGDLPSAQSRVEQSIALCRQAGRADSLELALALCAHAMIAVYQSQDRLAEASAQESLALFRARNDKWGMALTLNPLGIAGIKRHDYAGARACFEQSLSLFREVGDRWGAATPLLNLAHLDSIQGCVESASGRFEECIKLCQAVGERWQRALALDGLAHALHARGDRARANAVHRESLELLKKMGLKSSLAVVLFNFGRVGLRVQEYPLALSLFLESLVLFHERGLRQEVTGCFVALAEIAAVLAEGQHAARLLGAAEATLEATGVEMSQAQRADFDQAAAAARTRLDETDLATEWKQGRAMTIEQGVEYALQNLSSFGRPDA